MSGPPLTMEALAQTVGDLQRQLAEAHNQITAHQNQLNAAARQVTAMEQELSVSRNQASSSGLGTAFNAPKKNKPSTFNGRGSVSSWCVQMENYLDGSDDIHSLNIALSYLSGNAHEWWIVHSKSEEGGSIRSWNDFKQALAQRFETLNKEKIARDKLARWRQVKDVPAFNDDFNKILLDIPDMGVKDQIDRYSRGLKPYIWKALCTKEYTKLSDLMRDAERVESAFKRSGNPPSSRQTNTKPGNGSFTSGTSGPEPMDIGNVEIKRSVHGANFQLQKLSKEERDRCMREGLCLRCRQKGHLAKNCPKGQRN